MNTKLLAAWMVETRSRVFISTSRNGTILAMRKWVDVEHGRNHLITSRWCKLLTSVRETTSDVNGSQSTQYNPWDVNESVDVEHFTESFDRNSMM